MDQAVKIPLDENCGLTINSGRDGVWLHFSSSTGQYASINVDAMVEHYGAITGRALRDWCADRRAQVDAVNGEKS